VSGANPNLLRCSRMITYFVYIMSNKSRRLYVGISSKLPLRVLQHKFKAFPDSFTARYEFDVLVYFRRSLR
jgi:putative endonuclease